MSSVKLDVITLLPAVTVDTVDVALDDSPVIVSDVVKSVEIKSDLLKHTVLDLLL